MIQYPFEIVGAFEELAVRFGEVHGILPAGTIKDEALQLSIDCMKIVTDTGDLYYNDQVKTRLQTSIAALQATTPDPGGIVVPKGTAIASKWHLARTWARFMRRIDKGDNTHLGQFLTQASIFAYWAALKDNADNGVSEVLVP